MLCEALVIFHFVCVHENIITWLLVSIVGLVEDTWRRVLSSLDKSAVFVFLRN